MAKQVNCLVNEPGAGIHYMDIYDRLPKEHREALANADYNFCVACYYKTYSHNGRKTTKPRTCIKILTRLYFNDDD